MAFKLRGSGETEQPGSFRSRLISFKLLQSRGRATAAVFVPKAGTVGAMTRRARVLSPTDRIAVAHDALRKSVGGVLCVALERQLIGLLTLESLNRALGDPAANDLVRVSTDHLSSLMAGPEPLLELADVAILPESDPAPSIRFAFDSQPDMPLLGVVNSNGAYVGVVLRCDVVAARLGNLAPARIGGMATPLGVYLTDGVVQGGAGLLGLALAGASMSAMFTVAIFMVDLFFDLLAIKYHFDLKRSLAMGAMGIDAKNIRDFSEHVRIALAVPVMLVLLRLVPMAGYHAAEHQVVHAIEQGEPLVPDTVMQMPRPHPRCGTNIAAAVGIFSAALTVMLAATSSTMESVIPAALVTIATWRPVGMLLQAHLTTRPASLKQIESGIRAGRQVLDRFVEGGIERRPSLFQRVWNMGLVQVVIGAYSFVGILMLAGLAWPALGRWIDSVGF
jgi:hypothetical protein